VTTYPIERRKQSRRLSDRMDNDLLKTFSTPQCRLCLEYLGGTVLLLSCSIRIALQNSALPSLFPLGEGRLRDDQNQILKG